MTNPLHWRQKTLGEMMTDLKARLGFVTQGAGSKLVDPILKSFLQEGQDYVFDQLDAPLSVKRTEIKLVPGSKLYDFHNDVEDEDIDPHFVESIDVYETDTSIVHLAQGIREAHRCEAQLDRSCPRRYDTLNGQIEVWPTPDQNYRMVVRYREGPARLERAEDRPSVPSQLVFLYALASAKAHYGHADAQTAGQIFQQSLRSARSRRHENRRYFVGGGYAGQIDDRYYVQRTADGQYVL